MKKMLFIVNPKAGKKGINDHINRILDIFIRSGYNVEYHPTKGPNDAAEYVEKTGGAYDVIVCAGGDGTLDDTVTVLMKLYDKGVRLPALGYIPCGSTNDYARSLKLSKNPIKAARDIVSGTPCPVDVGMMGSSNFIYITAFGLFTDISYSTPQKLKNLIGHTAYILEAVKCLFRIETVSLKAKVDDEVVTGDFWYGQITNSRSVGGFRAIGVKEMSFSDGKFECLLIRKPKNLLQLIAILWSIATNKMNPKYIYKRKASKVTVISRKPVAWTTDGEFGGIFKRLVIQNRKRAISIILKDKSRYK